MGAYVGGLVVSKMYLGTQQVLSTYPGGAATPAFDPATLFIGADAGTVFDFGKASRLATATGGTGAMTEGGLIAYGSDTGPQGKHATQATSANRPRWLGSPRTLGTEAVSNGRFASDTVWTKGADWTIGSSKASKTAGSASSLSQTITLTAGQTYLISFSIERTAGTVQVLLTGGSTVSGLSRVETGSYIDMLVAETGNVTIEFSADAAFAGSVHGVSARPVTAFTNMGAMGDGASTFLATPAIDLSATDKATIVLSVTLGETIAASCFSEFSNFFASSPGSLAVQNSLDFLARTRGTSGEVTAQSTLGSRWQGSYVYSAVFDIGGATMADEIALRSRGVDVSETLLYGPTSGGNLANAVLTLMKSATAGQVVQGCLHQYFLINRKLTAPELLQVERSLRTGMAYCAVIGDSTVAKNTSADPLPKNYAVSSLVGGMVCENMDIAVVGEKIADQKAHWVALSAGSKDALEAVFIQVGLNDANSYGAAKTSAQIIADLQDLVDTVNADKPAGCKTYICGLNPARAWLGLGAGTAAQSYAHWQALNQAIGGGGATPITGVDARITSHVAALSDGSDNLAAIYDTNADGVHESAEGRFIIAQAWRTQLEADGLV